MEGPPSSSSAASGPWTTDPHTHHTPHTTTHRGCWLLCGWLACILPLAYESLVYHCNLISAILRIKPSKLKWHIIVWIYDKTGNINIQVHPPEIRANFPPTGNQSRSSIGMPFRSPSSFCVSCGGRGGFAFRASGVRRGFLLGVCCASQEILLSSIWLSHRCAALQSVVSTLALRRPRTLLR